MPKRIVNQITICSLFIFAACFTSAWAQVEFTEHNLTDTFTHAVAVFAADVDGDDDLDILGAARDADAIYWWENDGNDPPDFEEHILTDAFDGAWSVYVTDINNDGDNDILGAAWNADDIIYWENDGNENFTENTVTGDFDGVLCVHADDLDGDGDIDILGSGFNADVLAWWENDGNDDPEFTMHVIAEGIDGQWTVYTEDIDGGR